MAHSFFSIIITALNPGVKLALTLRSVLEQDYGNYEIIIKDGGSTDGSLCRLEDGTWGVSRGTEALNDSRIRIFRTKDKGIYDGMNQAIAHIQGRYVLFLNCGDRFYDSAVLGRAARFMEETMQKGDSRLRARPRIFYGDQFNELQKCEVHSAPAVDDLTCYRNVPCHQVCFYDAVLFGERGYDTDFRVRADQEHFLYCIYERNAEAIHMPMIVARYEGGGFSETKENRKRSAAEHKAITRYYLGRRKCFRYGLIMLLSLAPLRKKIAESPRFSKGYNAVKSAIYRRRERHGK